MSLEDRRATDIILDGHDPVLPSAAKITLIVPKGVLKEYLFETQSWLDSPDHWNDVVAASICPLGRPGPSDPTNSCNPLWYAHDPDDIGNRGYGYAFLGFPIILFGHLKNCSFLIFSNT